MTGEEIKTAYDKFCEAVPKIPDRPGIACAILAEFILSGDDKASCIFATLHVLNSTFPRAFAAALTALMQDAKIIQCQ